MTAPQREDAPSDEAARAILVTGARVIAHGRDLPAGLRDLVATIARAFDAESAAIVIHGQDRPALEIAATYGLDAAATAGLAAACQDPNHPIARTFVTPTPTFDVLPTRPGGPALRSHVPLTVEREGTDLVVGVLALAHDRPLAPSVRPVLLASADLAAVAIDRLGPPHP